MVVGRREEDEEGKQKLEAQRKRLDLGPLPRDLKERVWGLVLDRHEPLSSFACTAPLLSIVDFARVCADRCRVGWLQWAIFCQTGPLSASEIWSA